MTYSKFLSIGSGAVTAGAYQEQVTAKARSLCADVNAGVLRHSF